MQRPETIEFWNHHHGQQKENNTEEWILDPSKELLDSIQSEIIKATRHDTANSNKPIIEILEIGCGQSQLSQLLYHHCGDSSNVSFVVTDVSPTCIAHNKLRDATFLETTTTSFQYQVLDVLNPTNDTLSDDWKDRFHIILDKGCFDTFLFRGNNKQVSPIMMKLLNNIHMWLSPQGGKYLVCSPRKKIRYLRDYPGFHKVIRTEMQRNSAALLGDDLHGRRESVFMYTCTKQEGDTTVDGIPPDPTTPSSDHCPHCGMDRNEFVPSNHDMTVKAKSSCGMLEREDQHVPSNIHEMTEKATKSWMRRWAGHCRHCKG